MASHRVSLQGRFWRKVERGIGCWLWTGAKRPGGNGVFSVAHQPRPAHRIAWQIAYGPPPAGRTVLRTCGNRGCVRPGHLALGPSRGAKSEMRNMPFRGAMASR